MESECRSWWQLSQGSFTQGLEPPAQEWSQASGVTGMASLHSEASTVNFDCGSFFLVAQKKGNLVLVDSCPLESLVSCRGQRPASMPLWALTASPPQVRPSTRHLEPRPRVPLPSCQTGCTNFTRGSPFSFLWTCASCCSLHESRVDL